jgi:hypothetical protein
VDIDISVPPTVVIATTGTQGPPGNGVRHGAGPPASPLGVDGDFYIDNAAPSALVIYGPKTGGAWGAGVPLGAGSGASYYEHQQPSPAATWQVTHNLGRHPNISVILGDGRVAAADVQHASGNLAVITFPSTYAGTAMCS